MRAQGGPEEADSPVFLTVPINDVLAAALGTLGACAALFARRRLGRGQRVSITLGAASCLLQSAQLVRFDGARPAELGGRDFPGPGSFDRLYQAADGWVRLGASSRDGTAAAFAASLGLPDGQAADDAASAALAAAIGERPALEVVRLAAAAGLPAVRARQAPELAADRDLIRRGLLAAVEEDQAGVARIAPGRRLEMPGLVTAPPGEAPALGEHGAAILRENGFEPAAPGLHGEP